MSITGFPDHPPTRSGQSISDYYAGMLVRIQRRVGAALPPPHRQGAAHRPGVARQPADRARQPRRALHGRRRAPHPRGQRLLRRLELGRLSDDRRPRGHRGRRQRRGVAAFLRDHRPRRPRARSAVRDGARPGAIAATRSPRIIQGWTSAAPKAEVVRVLADGGVPAAPVNNVAEMVADPRCRRARCSSSWTIRSTGRSRRPGRP